MQREWKIRTRSHRCHHSDTPFEEGDTVITVIHWNPQEGDFERLDFSESGWQEHRSADQVFSSWRSVYQPPPPPEDKSGPVARESAESLLRRMVEDDLPGTENTRYVLALLLERRKQLKQTDARESELGRILFYEHVKSGELFLIKDPMLKLDELEPMQDEVAALLGAAAPKATAAPKPATEATAQLDRGGS